MNSLPSSAKSSAAWWQQPDTLLSLAMLGGLVVMLVPLPPFLLDVLLAINLASTVMLLLVTLGTRRALELSVFPSILLLLTLYRLALNVATTRCIMISGDAGRIVEAFGNYVVGGQLVVGLVIFLILVTIQFVVITKGAGRISEVAARFTLDAMPGKQMAIDAELNAGSITEKEAKRRRDELSRETEFYGAMDGAGKFVRGDAIAGLMITAVNLVGGVVIGMTQGLAFGESIRTYSILTVGDGLVSQIPALLIATTAGILTTKTTSEESLGNEIRTQFLTSERPLWIGAALLGLVGLMPGLPKLPFLSVAAGLVFYLTRRATTPPPAEGAETPSDPQAPPALPEAATEEAQLEDFLLSDRAVVEVGPRLVPFIESQRTKGMSARITSLRKDFSRRNGIWVPPIRVNSNLTLNPEEYRILIGGRVVARGELRGEALLAIPPEGKRVDLEGERTTEPAFGLEAFWISPESRRLAELRSCTVVDPLSVFITHLGEILRRHVHELFTRESLKKMLDHVATFAPTVVEEIKPETIRMGTLHQVLVQLAAEGIPLADLVLVLESIVNHAPHLKDVHELTDAVRVDLGRLVCEKFRDTDGRVRVVTLAPRLDSRLRQSLHQGQLALGVRPLEQLIQEVGAAWTDANRHDAPLAFLVDQKLRRAMKQVLGRVAPDLGVIAYQEVPQDLLINAVRILEADEILGSEGATPEEGGRPPAPLNAPLKQRVA